MAFIDDIASKLSGRTRAETNSVMTDATTRTYVGTATSASEDGSVYVTLSQDVTLPDDDDGEHGLGVEMPTTVAVDEGDEVLVTVFGGGVMKAPVVTGNPGWGDSIQTQVDSAETLAQQAEAVATATGQHFWTDNDGVHVTEVTQEDWNDAESPDYHSGANVLLNALGQLFRNRLNNLLAVLTSGIAIYDGNGNDSANILAEFTANRIRLGKKSSSGESTYAKVEFFDGDSLLASSVIPDGGEGVEGGRNNILLTDIYKLGELKAYGYHGISNQVTNDGQNTKEQAYSSMQAMTSDDSVYSSVGALVLRNNGGTPSSKITMHADYVDLSDNDTIKSVKMEQAIVALQQPYAMFTGSSGTATSTANGWRITWFNTVYSHSPNWSDYFSFSNGVITAKRNIQLEISGCMNWTDSVAGNRGFGVFVNSSTVGSGTEYSEFQMFPNTVNSRKSVWMAGLVLSLNANVHCAVGRYENKGAVYVNGTNFSRILLKVLGTF